MRLALAYVLILVVVVVVVSGTFGIPILEIVWPYIKLALILSALGAGAFVAFRLWSTREMNSKNNLPVLFNRGQSLTRTPAPLERMDHLTSGAHLNASLLERILPSGERKYAERLKVKLDTIMTLGLINDAKIAAFHREAMADLNLQMQQWSAANNIVVAQEASKLGMPTPVYGEYVREQIRVNGELVLAEKMAELEILKQESIAEQQLRLVLAQGDIELLKIRRMSEAELARLSLAERML